MPEPPVSVLLPVRDGLPHLGRAISSLGRQSIADFEVVAVDDGSTDGSGAVLDRWAQEDARVRVIHLPPSGLVAALNCGLEACRAPLVARMDADDISHPRRLELQAEFLAERPEVGVASCLVRIFPRLAVGEGFKLYEQWLNSLVSAGAVRRECFVESPVAHPSVVIRRECLAGAGGYRDAGWAEDYDLWLRLMEAGVAIAKVPRRLYFWREHGERLTRRDGRYAVDRFLRCKAHYLVRGPLRDRRPVVIWGAGRTGRRLSGYLIAEGARIEAFIDIDPAKIGRALRGVRVHGPEDLRELLGRGVPVLAAVASRGARALIRARLDDIGLIEGRDYWCTA